MGKRCEILDELCQSATFRRQARACVCALAYNAVQCSAVQCSGLAGRLDVLLTCVRNAVHRLAGGRCRQSGARATMMMLEWEAMMKPSDVAMCWTNER